jgi:hypothetical protein
MVDREEPFHGMIEYQRFKPELMVLFEELLGQARFHLLQGSTFAK